jgi:hypothetical protein
MAQQIGDNPKYKFSQKKQTSLFELAKNSQLPSQLQSIGSRDNSDYLGLPDAPKDPRK